MKAEINPVRLVVKALCLFVLINFLYALVSSQVLELSGYNTLFPGRTRLPFGIKGDPYTVSVDNVDTMFASHLISAPKGSKEYRIVLIGDSSVWGEDLGAYEMISEQWNKMKVQCGDETIRAYNLGYPHPSIVKDLVILEKAVDYEPDLIVWFVTLNTLISQRANPFLMANRERTANLLDTYDISFQQSKKLTEDKPNPFEKTLIGQRSNLARQIKLQMLGIIWTAAGADTNTLAENSPTDYNVSNDPRYRGLEPSEDVKDMLLFNALAAGYDIASPIPILIVNEPIFIADEEIAPVRYNPVYPRWAYDEYRKAIAAQALIAQWNYLDLWNKVPSEYFSDAGLHRSIKGERLLVQQINSAVQSMGCKQP